MRRFLAAALASAMPACGWGARDRPLAEIRPAEIGVIALRTGEETDGQKHPTATWEAPFDAYVIGWSIYSKTPGTIATLLTHKDVVLVRQEAASEEVKPQFLPASAGFRVARGDKFSLIVIPTEQAPDKTTGRTMAMIYYVAAQ